jgi:hypothetical protein
MPLTSDVIEDKILNINNLIHELEPAFKKKKPSDVLASIRFPWGIILKTDAYRNYFPFISNRTLNSNIAYTLQLTDVFRWIINWFNLKGVAREMLIKTGVILFTCVMEALTFDFVVNHIPERVNKRYKKNLDKLLKYNVINQPQFDNFNRCREWRDDIHLHRLVQPEREKYTLHHYNFALYRIIEMKDAFSNYFQSIT